MTKPIENAYKVIDAHVRADTQDFAREEMHKAEMQALNERCLCLERDNALLKVQKLESDLATTKALLEGDAGTKTVLEALEKRCCAIEEQVAGLVSRPVAQSVDTSSLEARMSAIELARMTTEGGGDYDIEIRRGGDDRLRALNIPALGRTVEIVRDGAEQMIALRVKSA